MAMAAGPAQCARLRPRPGVGLRLVSAPRPRLLRNQIHDVCPPLTRPILNLDASGLRLQRYDHNYQSDLPKRTIRAGRNNLINCSKLGLPGCVELMGHAMGRQNISTESAQHKIKYDQDQSEEAATKHASSSCLVLVCRFHRAAHEPAPMFEL